MTKRGTVFRAAAVTLPLIGLGASWAVTHARAQQGTEWDVPIRGYDPRDVLRGHFITFQYDWPGLASDDGSSYLGALCIDGTAPAITRAVEVDADTQRRCAAIARAADATGLENGLRNGVFYVSQTAARDYEAKLRDSKRVALLRVRIRDDGVMRPVSLRFRPKTAAEAAQDAP